MTPTFIIAEPGCTAEGDFARQLELLAIAENSGCNAFKVQWTSNSEKMAARRNAPDYLQFYRWLQTPIEWHADLAAYAHSFGLQYGCSVYLPEDVPLVAPFVDFLKVSSFEAEDVYLLNACRFSGLRTIVSVGMGAPLPNWFTGLEVLHCTSAYPAPVESLNLCRLSVCESCDPITGSDDFRDGLSDHSAPGFTWIGALAVAAGARVLETHMRSEQCRPENPDFAVARTPRQLTDYVRNVRFAEAALGSRTVGAHPIEAPMARFKVRA